MVRYIKRYWGFTRCAFSARLNYRGALFISILTSSVGLIASLFLWNVLFQEQSTISGYTWDDMIAYAMVAFVANATLSASTERKISEKVLDGSIATDLSKPLNFQDRSLFEMFGYASIEAVIAVVIATIAAFLLCDITKIITIERVGLLTISLIMAFMVKFGITYIAGLCCFYTSNGYGVVFLRQVITDIFSGAMLPLSFYPIWFQNVAGVLPFQSSVYVPTQLFLGRLTGQDAVIALLGQLIWIIALWIIGRMFFKYAVRKITIQGG